MRDKVAEKRYAREIEDAYVAGWRVGSGKKKEVPEQIASAALARANRAIRRIRQGVQKRTLEGPLYGTRGTCPEHGCQDREPVWYMPTKTSVYHPVCATYISGTSRVCFKKLTDVHVKED
jgi:ribosomal protein S5